MLIRKGEKREAMTPPKPRFQSRPSVSFESFESSHPRALSEYEHYAFQHFKMEPDTSYNKEEITDLIRQKFRLFDTTDENLDELWQNTRRYLPALQSIMAEIDMYHAVLLHVGSVYEQGALGIEDRV